MSTHISAPLSFQAERFSSTGEFIDLAWDSCSNVEDGESFRVTVADESIWLSAAEAREVGECLIAMVDRLLGSAQR